MSPKARSWQARQNKPEASSLGNYWQLLKRAHWERLTTKVSNASCQCLRHIRILPRLRSLPKFIVAWGAHVLKHLEDVVRLN